jgi:hypothetical protein
MGEFLHRKSKINGGMMAQIESTAYAQLMKL